MGLIDDMLNGNQRALSRIMTLVENDEEIRKEVVKKIHKHTGNAHIIGFTGPPGVGKSTTVNQIATEFLRRGKKVGVVAIDPSSPFSNGAILGDRIRMLGNEDNKNLFIRSLASRGKLGGLSKTTNDIVKLLDAFGKDVILIETVGIGQSEYDIAKSAHTTTLVLSPGYGDDIQAMKAGILETGDVFLVNKADMDGVHRTISELEGTVSMNFHNQSWIPPVLPIIARKGEGIKEVVDQFELHFKHLKESNEWELREKKRIENELEDHLMSWVETVLLTKFKEMDNKEQHLQNIYNKETDPGTIVAKFIEQQLKV